MDFFIFTTGVGVHALFESADQIGLQEEFFRQVQASSIIVRGYKAVAALKKVGIDGDIISVDGTIAGLQPQLEGIDFDGKCVVVQQYGASSPSLDAYLEQRGANVIHWLPYVHYPPEAEAIECFINE
ncbi:uroporphyrinogen-III synthase, partial [Bacillus sp. JCM 19041]|uniref:uroporphyrinogen-III synthase n=1 Tax=Bacillus sp. JCM 19041 TaxID=1460637 RepID=UPI0018D09C73